jgi:hypothetical protein
VGRLHVMDNGWFWLQLKDSGTQNKIRARWVYVRDEGENKLSRKLSIYRWNSFRTFFDFIYLCVFS